MTKIFYQIASCLLLLSLCTAIASAQEATSQVPLSPDALVLSGGTATMARNDAAAPIKPKRVSHRANGTKTAVPGLYASVDVSLRGESNNYLGTMFLLDNDSATYMTNVWGLGDTVKVNIDYSTGAVAIPPQKVYTHETYGDIYIYAISGTSYNPKASITGTIDDKGVITLGSWGVFCDANGPRAGAYFNAFSSSTWTPGNATMRFQDYQDETKVTTYQAHVAQTSPNEVIIYNFAGNGASVYGTLTPSKTIKVSPQHIMTHKTYGQFFCYPATVTKSGTRSTVATHNNRCITAKVDADTINFGTWDVADRDYATRVALVEVKSRLATSAQITWPEVVIPTFIGSGTEADPYQIMTADDVNALSQAVAGGSSFSGEFFSMANDIDFAGQTATYQPIGSAEAPFNATFDGNGFAISNLNVNSRGFPNVGLFGYTGSKAEIRNLTITQITLTSNGSTIGGAVGYNGGKISNVTVSGDINCEGTNAGGVAGLSKGSIEDCAFTGQVSVWGTGGGLVGYNYGTIVRSYASATVLMPSTAVTKADKSIGGLVGVSHSSGSTTNLIEDCYSMGQVTDQTGAGTIGGFMGKSHETKVNRCFNVASVSTQIAVTNNKAVGGFIADVFHSVISDCYNAGTVLATGAASDYVGGLFGYFNLAIKSDVPINLSEVTNCYNSGFISSTPTSSNKDASRRGVFGSSFSPDVYDPSDDFFKNVYSDNQITAQDNSRFGKLTAELTGTLPEGFSSEVWQVAEGQYPILKSTASSKAAQLSAAALHLSGTENVNKMKKPATLVAGTGIKWKLYDSGSGTFTDATSSLSISGNQLIVGKQYGSNILAAVSGQQSTMKPIFISAVPNKFKGDGSQANPYLIQSKADFIELDSAVRVFHQQHEGDFFLMTNDIDFNYADDFHGVGAGKAVQEGNNLYLFSGSFDGGGHTIHRLAVKSYELDASGKLVKGKAYNYGGLFRLCSAASIIKNVNIAADCRFDFYGSSGPVIGLTEGKVYDCRNYAPVHVLTSGAGGIVGELTAKASMARCYNAGAVTAEAQDAGGIVGISRGSVSLCQNDGDVLADHTLGGLAKAGSQQRAGGIAGTNYGTIDRSVNAGTVSAYKYVGGIQGNASNAAVLTSCVSSGIVYCMSDDVTRGGLSGYAPQSMVIGDSYYDSSVNPNGAAANGAFTGATGRATADLTAGVALQGLDAQGFDFKAGQYPVLKLFAAEPAAQALRSTYVKFSGKEHRTDVRHAEPLTTGGSQVWSLMASQGSPYKVADGQLLVDLTQVPDSVVVGDTLVVTISNSYKKVFALNSVPKILPGDGTAESPYQIRTRQDLDKLAAFVKDNGVEFADYYFRVENDIDYAGSPLNPIAIGNVSFKADFDGNGKTISGFQFANTTSSGGKNIGFFGNLGTEAVVHDLTLDGSLNGYSYIGGFVGQLYGTLRNCVNKSAVSASSTSSYVGGLAAETFSGSLIDNCHNEGTITPKSNYAGGIVAWQHSDSKIANCYNAAKFDGTYSYIGGIASKSQGTITNCYNIGEINAKGNLAGIASEISGADTVAHCYNTAQITGTDGRVAGIVATSKSGASALVDDCHNTGNISGHGYVGGVLGNILSGVVVTDCYNEGHIANFENAYAGGIVGIIRGSINDYNYMSRCYNKGDVESEFEHAGGIAGQVYSLAVDHVYNLGSIRGTRVSDSKAASFVGGLVGGIYPYRGDTCSLVDSWNAGTVYADGEAVGGISGSGDGPIIRCVNLADVTALGVGGANFRGNAGGLWGFGASAIFDCYNMGNVTANNQVGGIEPLLSSEIRRVYTAGRVTATDSAATAWAAGTKLNYKASDIDSAFYDATVNPIKAPEEMATGLITRDLFTESRLGDAFVLTRACYPTLVGYEDNVRTNFAAADTLLADGDTPTDVKSPFFVGIKPSVVWTSSTNLSVADDGTVTPTAKGEGWVRKTATVDGITLERTYVVNVTSYTGITDVHAAAGHPVSTVVYDINGARVSHPAQGALYIVVERFADGSQRATKRVVK